MKIKLSVLRALINKALVRETRYVATPPGRYKLQPIEIDADNPNDAAEIAANEY